MPDRTAPAFHTDINPHRPVRFYSAFPLFTMHYCAFVVIGPQGDPDSLVAKALEPHDVVRMRNHNKLAGDLPLTARSFRKTVRHVVRCVVVLLVGPPRSSSPLTPDN